MSESNNSRSAIYLPLVFAMVMIFGMQIGFKMYEGLKGSKKSIGSSATTVEEVLNYIDSKYVDDVDEEKIIQEVIENTLNELDPHSSYLTREELKADTENLQGNFDGIGIEFSMVRDTIVVVSPISGGPSEELGIVSGDKIVKIEAENVAGVKITTGEIVSKLRGERGTSVNISIQRHGLADLLDFKIKRAKIPLYSLDVGYMLDEEIGYLKVNRFSGTTTEEFNGKLRELVGADMKKLILDLRQNPGGYLSAATDMCDELLDKKRVIVYTEGEHQKRKDYLTKIPGLFEQGELAILIDEGSASASEIVAGSLQDWERATIIGRRSFGKGLVQEQYKLSDGSAMRLTIARYHTPTGRCIQKPYDEGEDAYNEEVFERIASGEMVSQDSIKVADSLRYETPSGNIVYGGGGVYPDIFVPIDTTAVDDDFYALRSMIPSFSYTYFGEHKGELESAYASVAQLKAASSFEDQLIAEFREHVVAEKQKFDPAVFSTKRKDIGAYLKAYIARQMWQNDGFYPIVHEVDDTFQKAYQFLKEK